MIALAAWTGLALDYAGSVSHTGSLATSLWILLRFFTILTNLLVAAAFTTVAAGHGARIGPRAMAGLSLAIMLVGIVFKLLLEGPPPHRFVLDDFLLHKATPMAVPAFWLAFVPKGRLRLADPFLWLLYPMGYLIYALLRGALDGRYPYPFLDVAVIGWGGMAVNAAAIGVAFVAAGLFSVWIDRNLGRRRLGSTTS